MGSSGLPRNPGTPNAKLELVAYGRERNICVELKLDELRRDHLQAWRITSFGRSPILLQTLQLQICLGCPKAKVSREPTPPPSIPFWAGIFRNHFVDRGDFEVGTTIMGDTGRVGGDSRRGPRGGWRRRRRLASGVEKLTGLVQTQTACPKPAEYRVLGQD